MGNRVINWKYFIGWKIFMYFSFLLVYFNCFYFVRQYSLLKQDITNLESTIVELQGQFLTKETKNVSVDITPSEIYGIVKKVDKNFVSIDYVQLLGGVESLLAAQEDDKCFGEELSSCGEEFYVRNLNETENDLMLDEDAKYSVLTLGPEEGVLNVTQDEFINNFQTSDRKEFYVVSLIIEYDYDKGENFIKEIHQIYTP